MTVNASDPELALYDTWRAQQLARPASTLTLQELCRHVEAVKPADLPWPEVARVLCVPDLYLVCGCLVGDPAALSAFEVELTPVIERAVQSFGAEAAAEVAQGLRAALLVDHRGRGPLLREYRGEGALRRWLRVVAVREATRLYHAGKREAPADDDALFERLVGGDDLRSELVRLDASRQFRAAFTAALSALEPRERTVLRMHLVDGLSIDQIAPAFEVHRATAARWVSAAREALLGKTRQYLMRELALGAGDADSLIRAARSNVDLSLERLLGRG